MFVTGPDVVKAVTGENVSMNDLGGGELHNFLSIAHYLADDEVDAIDYVRSLLSYLPSNWDELPPHYTYTPSVEDEKAACPRSRPSFQQDLASPTTSSRSSASGRTTVSSSKSSRASPPPL